jgi:hypothetical protein
MWAGLGWSGQGNTGERLINVVIDNKPKVLTGLDQKVDSLGEEVVRLFSWPHALPAERADLPHSGMAAPVLPPTRGRTRTSRQRRVVGIPSASRSAGPRRCSALLDSLLPAVTPSGRPPGPAARRPEPWPGCAAHPGWPGAACTAGRARSRPTAVSAPAALRALPAVACLRQNWGQHDRPTADGVPWRANDHMPPAARCVSSSYAPDAHAARQHTTQWGGYTVHLPETCDAGLPS